MRGSSLVALSIAVLALPATAHADDGVEIGTNVLVVSENDSPESAGYLGLQLVGMHYEGHVGIGVEVGIHDWAQDGSAKWLGILARLAVVDYEGELTGDNCRSNRQPDAKRCRGKARVWLELGAARESWKIDDFDLTTRTTRNRYSAGVGVDALFDMFGGFGGTAFFRVHRADPEMTMSSFGDPIEHSYETSLVAGVGFTFGGYR